MNPWTLVYDGFDPGKEKLREALCTVGNGYFATRGAAPEATADDVHYPGTYLAGGYNRLQTEIAGRVIENEDLVNFPNWLPLSLRVEGEEWFDLRRVDILHYRQELFLREGVLQRTVRFRDEGGRITLLRQRRFVHLVRQHLAALETEVVAENWSGRIEFCTALDGTVINDGVARYGELSKEHLEVLASEIKDELLLLRVRTVQSRLEVVQSARTRVYLGDRVLSPERRSGSQPGRPEQFFTLDIEESKPVRVEKIVALYTSRDRAVSEPGGEAKKALLRAETFAALLQSHETAWKHLWERFNIELDDSDILETGTTMTALRLHIFHLLQTVSLYSMELDVGVPSRGWHGEAYRGHIFWDELFIFPLLNLRLPEITRALLKYRYRRLDEARCMAREAGLRGAMYPWQSGSDGREESQRVHLNPKSGRWLPDHTHLQRHVSAAVAWNVWQYFQVSRDTEFMIFHGTEMILEIARFWASLATWNAVLERFEIHGVMGPDEYHDAYPWSSEPGLSNNAYTNVMAVWTLHTARQALEILPDDRRREITETLDLRPEELELWERITRRMRLCFHDEGIISQFEGYERLEEFDWESYRRRYGQVMRLDRILEAEGDTPNRYKASKQADVLMLFYLFSSDELREIFKRLGYPFTYETIPRTIEYYIRRTSHGSTLSQVVHSWVLARSDRDRSWELFNLALRSDIDDIQGGTTPEGIHLGAMAGTVDLLQRGYTGLETRGDTLHFNPCLPRELSRLRMHIRYRGQSIAVDVSRDAMTLTCLQCRIKPIHVGLPDRAFELHGGETKEISLRPTE